MATDEGREALDANWERVDRESGDWRQGDVFRFDQLASLVVTNLDFPLTPASLEAAQASEGDDRIAMVWHDEDEFALVSQDCDVVDHSSREPYVSVSPVITIPAHHAHGARHGWMPGLAPVPALGPERCADLSRIVTVEKSVLLGATRIARLRDDDEMKMFRGVVHRHFSRAAFPDELQPVLRPLLKRLREKRGQQSPEGRAVEATHDIRIKGYPSWDAEEIDVTIHFLCFKNDFAALTRDEWGAQRDSWVGLLQADATGRIKSIELSIDLYEELSAADYYDSDALDLGGLSPQPD